MRMLFNPQRPLFSQWPNHKYDGPLKICDEVLNENRQIYRMVYDDLGGNRKKDPTGALGMNAEQVVRAAIIKQQNSWSYQELAIQCADSDMTKAFVKLIDGRCPSKSSLQENISKIKAITWQKINELLVIYAGGINVEDGRTIRMDATVIESNIHHPTDSSLIYDCIRVVRRALKHIRKEGIGCIIYASVKGNEAKNLVLKIVNAGNDKERKRLYRKLLRLASRLQHDLPQIIKRLQKKGVAQVSGLARQLKDIEKVNALLPQIISQTERRVIRGEKVPPEEKIVSIFEDHTDIIVKGQREIEFGHKVFLVAGKSGLITDCQLVQGNPADSEYFLDLIETQKRLYGHVPRQTTADGGFASEDNLLDAKIEGVKDVCFSKTCGLAIEEMVKSKWVFEKLRNFRAGIEGLISVLKRAFGLGRVVWKGVSGFGAYVHSSVVAYNLAVIARFRLAQNVTS